MHDDMQVYMCIIVYGFQVYNFAKDKGYGDLESYFLVNMYMYNLITKYVCVLL